MPTYEYECKCGNRFEVFQSIRSGPMAKCKACGKRTRRKISSGGGIIFKGSGFYSTDYPKKPQEKTPCDKCREKCPAKETKEVQCRTT